MDRLLCFAAAALAGAAVPASATVGFAFDYCVTTHTDETGLSVQRRYNTVPIHATGATPNLGVTLSLDAGQTRTITNLFTICTNNHKADVPDAGTGTRP